MKKLLTIFLLAFCFTINAQDKLTEYTYAIHISDSNSSMCLKEKVAYFSPIITHNFKDDHRMFDERSTEGYKYATRWKNKVNLKFNISKEYCFTSTAEHWEKTYSEIDAERDKWMKFYKDSGYKIYSTYTFGFQ